MEKAIVKGIVIIAICAVLVSVAQASVSIENSMDISGTGIIDHSIDAQTDFMLTGQKYTEWTRTPALGLFGISTIESRTEFSMLCNNETDISVEGATISNYTKSRYCMRNYDLGVVQNLKVNGNDMIAYEFMADNFSSIMIAEGAVNGYMEYNIVVRDTDTFKKIYDENYELEGKTKFNIESNIENVTYPGAGNKDWLGCP